MIASFLDEYSRCERSGSGLGWLAAGKDLSNLCQPPLTFCFSSTLLQLAAINRLHGKARFNGVPFFDVRRVVYVHELVDVRVGEILDRVSCEDHLAIGAVYLLEPRLVLFPLPPRAHL